MDESNGLPSDAVFAGVSDLQQSGTVLSTYTTVITNGQTYTSTSIDVSAYSSVITSCKSDRSGILYLEFSPNNTNWDSGTTVTILADTINNKVLNILQKYFCYRMTNNSGSNQTYLRIQVLAGNQTPDITVNATIDTSAMVSLDNKTTVSNTDDVKISSIPNIIVSTLPSVTIGSMPSVVVSSLPSVVVSSLPSVVVSSMPTISNSQELPAIASITPLLNGQTFTSNTVDVSSYNTVIITCKTDQVSILYIEFSPDSTNWDSSLQFNMEANINEIHRLSVSRKYFRYRIVNNSGSDQTYLRSQVLAGSQTSITSALNTNIQADSDTLLCRSIITGKLSNGSYANVPVTSDGHLQISIDDPRLPFGSIHTEKLYPVFQTDAVYGLNTTQISSGSTLSGVVASADALFTCSTGTTIYAQSYLQTIKRLRYRPGQGVVVRFTGKFSAPANSSYLVIGIGHGEDGLFFGYKNNDFGILYNNRGIRETRVLTITTGSSTAQSVTVTLNGVAFSIAVTNSANIYRTAYELSLGDYAGWGAISIGSTVVFLSDSVGAKSSTYSLSGSTIIGSFSQQRAGGAVIETFIPQSTWNIDTFDGTGPSGVTANWQKGNVFQIGMQYLGFGTLTFMVETAVSGASHGHFSTCHVIKNPNTLDTSSLRNPSFPFTMAASSAGSTTNLSISTASFAGFIEGSKILHGNRFSYYAQSTTVTAAGFIALFSIKNMLTYKSITNQCVINITSISAAIKHTSPTIIYIIKNGALVGNPNFIQYSTNSCSAWDTASTSVTFSANEQLIWSGHLGDTGEFEHTFLSELEEFTIQPNEMITVAAKTTTGTAQWVTASLNTREDQ